MFLAALLGLIDDPSKILDELKELDKYISGVSDLELKVINTKRSGIFLNQIKVELKESKHKRTAKTLKEALTKFLAEHTFSEPAKIYAINVLNSLIHAESEVHGKLDDYIHLHELSSVDTLIDILGVTKVLDLIGAFAGNFKIYCSKLPLGGGVIETAHGILPVPAPATLKILESSNLIIYNGPIDSELVTPTGAALLVNLNPQVLNIEMNLRKASYSTGSKSFDNFLNILRIFYGESQAELTPLNIKQRLEKYVEKVAVLETEVDDVDGELLGNFIKQFEDEKILDLKILSGITKKNRPSHTIRIMCHPEYRFELIERIMDELGTLGVRMSIMERVCIDRKTEYHKIEINEKKYELGFKISFIDDGISKKIINIKPEYEDMKKISEDSGLSVKKIQFFAQSLLKDLYKEYTK
jgi:uncharacterized protein (TIGR00299 family) protein